MSKFMPYFSNNTCWHSWIDRSSKSTTSWSLYISSIIDKRYHILAAFLIALDSKFANCSSGFDVGIKLANWLPRRLSGSQQVCSSDTNRHFCYCKFLDGFKDFFFIFGQQIWLLTNDKPTKALLTALMQLLHYLLIRNSRASNLEVALVVCSFCIGADPILFGDVLINLRSGHGG